MEARYFFVFDVESVGLHGDVFSYGYVVVENAPQMTVVDRGRFHQAGRMLREPLPTTNGLAPTFHLAVVSSAPLSRFGTPSGTSGYTGGRKAL